MSFPAWKRKQQNMQNVNLNVSNELIRDGGVTIGFCFVVSMSAKYCMSINLVEQIFSSMSAVQQRGNNFASITNPTLTL